MTINGGAWPRTVRCDVTLVAGQVETIVAFQVSGRYGARARTVDIGRGPGAICTANCLERCACGKRAARDGIGSRDLAGGAIYSPAVYVHLRCWQE